MWVLCCDCGNLIKEGISVYYPFSFVRVSVFINKVQNDSQRPSLRCRQYLPCVRTNLAKILAISSVYFSSPSTNYLIL